MNQTSKDTKGEKERGVGITWVGEPPLICDDVCACQDHLVCPFNSFVKVFIPLRQLRGGGCFQGYIKKPGIQATPSVEDNIPEPDTMRKLICIIRPTGLMEEGGEKQWILGMSTLTALLKPSLKHLWVWLLC